MHTAGFRPRGGPTIVGSVVALVAAAMTVQPAAVAGPATAGQQPAPGHAATIDLHGVATGPKTITLVTGDRVRLTPVGGSYGVDPEPAGGDGRLPRFLTETGPDGTYVFPDDALAAVDAGRLDRELFNVTYLAENGYTDADTTSVPVIVQYPPSRSEPAVAAAADALPASTPTLRLGSLHASAVAVSKSHAGRFWSAVRGTRPEPGLAPKAALGAGLARIWLDRKVSATLDQSVPLVGAPEAWARGHDGTGVKVAILDTGIDLSHPDLVGKVDQARSFVPDVTSVQDGFGHGTHVASIVTGSGAASGGKYKGVAPGVRLEIGKVLNDSGRGMDSWIIAGMQWAAASGAKVVSMSLGGGPSDGSDPMSQAVNDLTAQTGVLFVIAAGNAGPRAATVATPGAADAALTVAATDKTDHLASFSSRGPRFGDSALKPDIAAPGVSIVAARAAGTSGGTPVDEWYTTLSGTSMATPHVAGAAAILAQTHPDWTAAQLKAALMSTARDDGLTVYQQGAGRLDVARADRQQVFATTANLDYGSVPVDETPGPLTRQVTYVNTSPAPVTLTLTATLRTTTRRDASGAVSADPTVTVPAGGTASTTVTVDPDDLAAGGYTGSLVATDETTGTRLTTPVGLVREPPTYTLTVHTVGRDGQPLSPFAQANVDVAGDQGILGGTVLTTDGTTMVRLRAGTYSVTQLVSWLGADSHLNYAWLAAPEVALTGDTEITLDARIASQVRFDTPQPAESTSTAHNSVFQRDTATGLRIGLIFRSFGPDRVWASPTEPVTTGTVRFYLKAELARPELTLRVVGGPALHPALISHGQDGTVTADGHPGFRHFLGREDLALVDVGSGSPEDLAGRDLRGRLVMLETGTADTVLGPECGAALERVEQIRDAGAAGILAFPGAASGCSIPGPVIQKPFTGPSRPTDVPMAWIPSAEGLDLRAGLVNGPVTVRVNGQPESPYSYALAPYEEGRIPASLHYAITDDQLARIDLSFQDDMPAGTWYQDSLFMTKADDVAWASSTISTPHTGSHRVDYVGPLSADVVHLRIVTSAGIEVDANGNRASGPSSYGALQVFDAPVHLRQRWLVAPLTPGATPVTARAAGDIDPQHLFPPYQFCTFCREGDQFLPMLYMTSVGGGFPQDDGLGASHEEEDNWNLTYHLYRDGTEIPATPLSGGGATIPAFTLPAEEGHYRLTAQGPHTDAAWTFTSSAPDADAVNPGYVCTFNGLGVLHAPCRAERVLFARYDLGRSLAEDNTVPAGRAHAFTVEVYQPQTPEPVHVAGARVWTSTDDGAHWTPAVVASLGGGRFAVTAVYPDYARTTGAVSLRVQTWDTDGDTLTQTTLRAVGLRGSTPTNAS